MSEVLEGITNINIVWIKGHQNREYVGIETLTNYYDRVKKSSSAPHRILYRNSELQKTLLVFQN